MNTPIRDFVEEYVMRDSVRLHMPGHKGKEFLGCEKYDITEIDGADVLYSAKGIIKESEDNASALFGTYKTFYSAEGSSLCIKAMLSLVVSDNKSCSRKILAARNVHKAFLYACALLDLDVDWIYPEKFTHLCSCDITAEDVKKKLLECEVLPDAVYLTSPDYLGNILDIKSISSVCDEFGVPVIVDNAHGAYLHFLKKTIHPIDEGAYICCDSAHKTLPVLTGGAYLHFSEKAKHLALKAESALSLFASTSPSYIILQSLDMCNAYLDGEYKNELENTVKSVKLLKEQLTDKGFIFDNSEPLKLVLNLKKTGISAESVILSFKKHKIEPEFFDNDYIVMMFTPQIDENGYKRVFEAFSDVKCEVCRQKSNSIILPKKAKKMLGIREAIFSDKETVKTVNALGRICADPCVSCPPAVPIVISGEEITEESVQLFLSYGIDEINVVL